jgi:outer membrane protein OmpA-like peptidoglycan-associated protein
MDAEKPSRHRLKPAYVAWAVAAILILACAWLFLRPEQRNDANARPPAPARRDERETLSTKSPSATPAAAASSRIPLEKGLRVISVGADRQYGDLHSISEVTAVTADRVLLKLSMDSGRARRFDGTLTLNRVDMANSLHYNKLVYPDSPQERLRIGSFLGPSSRVMTALKTQGRATFFDWREPPTEARRYRSGGGPEMAVVRVKRVEDGPKTFRVLVNDRLTEVPAIYARGTLEWDYGGPLANVEFAFFDDVENPLTLHRSQDGLAADVTQIWLPEQRAEQGVERQLRDEGRAAVYGVYFDLGAATIRPGFDTVLEDIAATLGKNPTWKLQIEGHTDNIGGDAANQALSERRAATVKSALVERHRIDTARLSTVGFGASRPKDSNETLIGRAQNRRVELVRLAQ